MDSFVRKISRTKSLVALGIIFVLLLILIQYEGSQKSSVVKASPTTTATPGVAGAVAKAYPKKTALDITKNYSCNYASMSAEIFNKQIYIRNSHKKPASLVLFKGDCLYSWSENARAGTKKCGLGQYVTLYESLSKIGVANDQDIFSTALSSGMLDSVLSPAGPSTQSASIAKFAKSCRETQIVNQSSFDPPRNVTFSPVTK